MTLAEAHLCQDRSSIVLYSCIHIHCSIQYYSICTHTRSKHLDKATKLAITVEATEDTPMTFLTSEPQHAGHVFERLLSVLYERRVLPIFRVRVQGPAFPAGVSPPLVALPGAAVIQRDVRIQAIIGSAIHLPSLTAAKVLVQLV